MTELTDTQFDVLHPGARACHGGAARSSVMLDQDWTEKSFRAALACVDAEWTRLFADNISFEFAVRPADAGPRVMVGAYHGSHSLVAKWEGAETGEGTDDVRVELQLLRSYTASDVETVLLALRVAVVSSCGQDAWPWTGLLSEGP